MGFEPICAQDDIVGADGCDIKFGAFLMVVAVGRVDADSLNSGVLDGARFVVRTVDVFNG